MSGARRLERSRLGKVGSGRIVRVVGRADGQVLTTSDRTGSRFRAAAKRALV